MFAEHLKIVVREYFNDPESDLKESNMYEYSLKDGKEAEEKYYSLIEETKNNNTEVSIKIVMRRKYIKSEN